MGCAAGIPTPPMDEQIWSKKCAATRLARSLELARIYRGYILTQDYSEGHLKEKLEEAESVVHSTEDAVRLLDEQILVMEATARSPNFVATRTRDEQIWSNRRFATAIAKDLEVLKQAKDSFVEEYGSEVSYIQRINNDIIYGEDTIIRLRDQLRGLEATGQVTGFRDTRSLEKEIELMKSSVIMLADGLETNEFSRDVLLRDGGREGSFKETIEFVEAVIASGMDTIRLFEDHIIGLEATVRYRNWDAGKGGSTSALS